MGGPVSAVERLARGVAAREGGAAIAARTRCWVATICAVKDESEISDRKALEKLIGTERARTPWPAGAWPAGTRVRVVKDPSSGVRPWQQEFTGTISATMPPKLVEHPQANPSELAYFVAFDEPQRDDTNLGPYRKAEIWDRFLRRIDLHDS